jgi:hypothetical protein
MTVTNAFMVYGNYKLSGEACVGLAALDFPHKLQNVMDGAQPLSPTLHPSRALLPVSALQALSFYCTSNAVINSTPSLSLRRKMLNKSLCTANIIKILANPLLSLTRVDGSQTYSLKL